MLYSDQYESIKLNFWINYASSTWDIQFATHVRFQGKSKFKPMSFYMEIDNRSHDAIPWIHFHKTMWNWVTKNDFYDVICIKKSQNLWFSTMDLWFSICDSVSVIQYPWLSIFDSVTMNLWEKWRECLLGLREINSWSVISSQYRICQFSKKKILNLYLTRSFFSSFSNTQPHVIQSIHTSCDVLHGVNSQRKLRKGIL